MTAILWIPVLFLLQLLPVEERLLKGRVLDPEGRSMAGVRIDHYGVANSELETTSNGKFEVRTAAPRIILRKIGFVPQVINTRNGLEDPVVMNPDRQLMKSCGKQCPPGTHRSLCFAAVQGVARAKPVNDVDYVMDRYVARSGKSTGTILHGIGPSWSLGVPASQDVWQSVEYSERDFVSTAGTMIVNAHGTKANGAKWGFVGMVGEAAWYGEVTDGVITSRFDRFLSGACLAANGQSTKPRGYDRHKGRP